MTSANLRLFDERLEPEKNYWLRQLAGEPVPAGLPLDYTRPAVFTQRTEAVELDCEPEAVAGLHRLCGENEALAFTVLTAALQVCLSRYAGAEDVVVGTTIHRRHAEVAALNRVLALRGRVEPGAQVRELLAHVKQTVADAYANQKYPFKRLLQLLGVEPPHNRAPLFNVVILLESINDPAHAAELRHDLTVLCARRGGRLGLRFEYSPRLFKRETVAVFAEHFQAVLGALVAAPDRVVDALELRPARTQARWLEEFNRTAADYPRDRTAHELFEAQAALTPDAVAVVDGGEQLTYGELNNRANRLAHHLRALGVGPGTQAAVLLEHSPRLLVALLGVLKAGGAYVPIDPEHPRNRIAFVLRDARCVAVLTDGPLAERLPEGAPPAVLLDRDWPEIARASGANPAPTTTPGGLAYVIYTSGSTGEPKGVQIEHAALVNYVWWAREVYLRGEPLNFALYSTIAFDLTVTSVYVPLITGSRIHIYRKAEGRSPLDEALTDDRVEVLKLTPSHLALLAARDNRGSRLRRLVVGGEALTTELARAVQRSFGREVEIYNEYGPTEATVGCMIHRFGAGADDRVHVPIGRPAANARVYVLDERLRPVAENVVGELYIAGDGLAVGYLNKEGLTAERFIPDPFDAGARMYRTGDLARVLPGGELDLIGRRDEQVKFRGYRVELNEIRSALNRHPEIRDSVVVLANDAQARPVMVAYYVSRRELEGEQLREFLSDSIIEETLPNLFVHLRRLPLTLNGKINYRALPTVEEAREQVRRRYVGARNADEAALLRIWDEVLGVERVGVHDSFFEWGGHSLLGTQVISRVRETLGVELPLRSLFETPTVAGLAEKVAAARDLERTSSAPAIRPAAHDGRRPPSYAQSRLWFLHQMEPDSPLYNVPAAIRIKGRLDVAALERSLDEIVARHESLRTTFGVSDGQPVQVIGPAAGLALTRTDLSGLDAAAREAEVGRLARAEAGRGFDLARGPLIRAGLLRLAEGEHVLLLTMHHIISDGWSMGVLVREAAALYGAYTEGRPSPLAPLPVQYGDHAEWQREWLSGERLEELTAYWKQHLSGAAPVLELPTDRARPAAQSYRGGRLSAALSDGLSARLNELARAEGVTPFVLLLAAFRVLLYRYTGQTDIVVGTGIANRNRAEIEPLIGFFTNTLVLRNDLAGDPTFRELLSREKEVALGGFAHQDLPFDKLVEELQPERSLSHMPLFQVMFALQNAPMPELRLSGVTLSFEQHYAGTAKFDLMLAVGEEDGHFICALEYSTDLFNAGTVERMLGHLTTLLEGLGANPGERIARLPLLSEAERDRALVEWNQTARPYEQDLCVQQIFERQAALTPLAPAVEAGGQRLNYAELNRRANQLAHHLRSLGVGPEAKVGLYLEPSSDVPVAMLAVLKAGGAYVPLDAAQPAGRTAYMLEDCGVAVLLTQERLAGRLPAHAARVVTLDADREEIGRQREDDPECRTTADNLVYVMYTSGSTGEPKGIAIVHRAVNRLVRNVSYVELNESHRVAQASNLAFDASTFEVWGALLNGACLAVAPPPPLGLEELGAFVRGAGVTTLWLTAGLFHQVVEGGLNGFGGVRQLLAGGDVLSAPHVRRALGVVPGLALINGYGPTECTTFAVTHRMEQIENGAVSIPIGRPISNTTVYVLGRDMQPATVGAVGELHIGGPGLARGYVNRPELTAERFVPHPFSKEPGARLYRTGDLVRYRADGVIEFVGRLDNQVKLRGFRIEPGEIEATLRQHPAVADAAVIVREAQEGDKRLVAYVAGTGADASELRAFLRRKLPEYMVPSAFIVLERLPLNANGKLDRAALPDAPAQAAASAANAEAHRTPVEELLAGIWASVLGVERVGADDNFFDLGGHSLLATKAVSRVREVLGADVQLRDLFDAPTAAGFAAAVEARLKQSAAGADEPPLARAARGEGPLPLSFAQQRLWFLDQLEPGRPTYNVPAAVRLRGDLDLKALARSFAEMTRRHESLRTVFRDEGGTPVQVVLPACEVALPVEDLTALAEPLRETEARARAHAEVRRPFDLTTGPLLRALVLRLDESEHVVVLTMHHIISDAWAMELFIRELTTLYGAFVSGEGSPLAELPVQYADYAVWQRGWLRGERLREQVEYWRGRLAGAPPVLELPTDRPRTAAPAQVGASQSRPMPPQLAQSLRALSRRANATLFMTLLAAFEGLLYRYTGQEDIVVGTTVANRRRAETEGLIGFFVNMLVLRTNLSGNPTFEELLGRVREVTLGAYAHQDVPFEKLVEVLRPDRALSSSPLFQVVFGLHHLEQSRPAPPALDLRPVALDSGVTQFDLIVRVIDGAGGLSVMATYNVALFDGATIDRLLGHYEAWLAAVVARPDRRLLDIPLGLPAPGGARAAPEAATALPDQYGLDEFTFSLS
ncbi:MAG: amino acid adenylation domain-containing protein [Acidobacteria bacterium]|nr:amino acid adenylation domain-containing protein [Acidobacteriota bacterium]